MSEYEIFALKYAGPFTSPSNYLLWLRDEGYEMEREYFIWCLKGKGETVVVDAGVSPAMASRSNLNGYVNPADILLGIDVRAEEVNHVILTHLHWDHCSGVDLFPNATFYIQEKEFNFWIKEEIARRLPFEFFKDPISLEYLANLENTTRLALLDGDQEILPCVTCNIAPGHTLGLQVVSVNTAKGCAIVGSDCAHLFRNYEEDWPTALIMDLVAWMKSYDKVKALASSKDLLFPGHDPLMSKEYPEVAKLVTQLV